ncbi:hypothetical protein Naga_100224g7, partial [Nannochloropsis gaditana]
MSKASRRKYQLLLLLLWSLYAVGFRHFSTSRRHLSPSDLSIPLRATAATSSTTSTSPPSLASSPLSTSAARSRPSSSILDRIKAQAGTPEVLALLKEAVAATGTGEVKREFFKAIFPFPLDDFQLAALDALGGRENVVVSAPTGSGKQKRVKRDTRRIAEGLGPLHA